VCKGSPYFVEDSISLALDFEDQSRETTESSEERVDQVPMEVFQSTVEHEDCVMGEMPQHAADNGMMG